MSEEAKSKEQRAEIKNLGLGPCCACGSLENVRNLIMLDKKSPTPGKGWGCFQCGLLPDGAIAVLCDDCIFKKVNPQFACVGYPGERERIAIDLLKGEHKHNETKHPEMGYTDDSPEEDDTCEGCGRGPYDDGQCPLCCGHMFAPGSEQCDFCAHGDECAEHARGL